MNIKKKIKITMFSNFMNHHQLPLCLELFNTPGVEFNFVATSCIPEERIKLGYQDLNKSQTFIVREYETKNSKNIARTLAVNSDVVIFGSAPIKYFITSIKNNNITFRYSERLFKNDSMDRFNPLKYLGYWLKYSYGGRKAFLLAASGYATMDYNALGLYKERSYKWGYFPETVNLDINKIIEEKTTSSRLKILWVGRLIEWKHPDQAIRLAKSLNDRGHDFELSLIGSGKMDANLRELISELNLSGRVKLLGSMNPDEVRLHMNESRIFLMTSDYGEGWGAVINEAMNSACVVVASRAVGAVPFLINQSNGIIYDNSNDLDLLCKVESIINDSEKMDFIGRNAYRTIVERWNSKTASSRLVKLSNQLIKGEIAYFDEGPLSKDSKYC